MLLRQAGHMAGQAAWRVWPHGGSGHMAGQATETSSQQFLLSCNSTGQEVGGGGGGGGDYRISLVDSREFYRPSHYRTSSTDLHGRPMCIRS